MPSTEPVNSYSDPIYVAIYSAVSDADMSKTNSEHNFSDITCKLGFNLKDLVDDMVDEIFSEAFHVIQRTVNEDEAFLRGKTS